MRSVPRSPRDPERMRAVQSPVIPVVGELIKALNPFGPFPDAKNPLAAPILSKKIAIVPTDAPAREKPSANQIELKFECSIK